MANNSVTTFTKLSEDQIGIKDMIVLLVKDDGKLFPAIFPKHIEMQLQMLLQDIIEDGNTLISKEHVPHLTAKKQ